MNLCCILACITFNVIPIEFQSRMHLLKSIIPNDSITWWQYGNAYWINSDEASIIYCSDSVKNYTIPKLTETNTFSSNYFNSFSSDYLAYVTKSSKINFIHEEKELINFICPIDNLEEALFLTSLYGYWFKPSKKYGSYRTKNGNYRLNLYKITNPPDVLPVSNINRRGKISVEKPIKAKIYIEKNGDIFEIKGLRMRKIQADEMRRPL